MVVDMAGKKKAREERIQAKRDMISAEQPEAESAPEESKEEVKEEVKEVEAKKEKK